MSTVRKNAVAEREVTHFVLASLSDRGCFLYSFYTLSVLLLSVFFLCPCLYLFLCLALFMSV